MTEREKIKRKEIRKFITLIDSVYEISRDRKQNNYTLTKSKNHLWAYFPNMRYYKYNLFMPMEHELKAYIIYESRKLAALE